MTESPRQDPLDDLERAEREIERRTRNGRFFGDLDATIVRRILNEAVTQLRAERARVEEVAKDIEARFSSTAPQDVVDTSMSYNVYESDLRAWATRLKEGRT